MKYSNKNDNLITKFIMIVLKPNKTIKTINEKEQNLLESLLIVILSGIIFILGIFLVGGTIFNLFYEQYSTFLLEKFSSGAIFGYGISKYDFIIIFISMVIFIVKSWLFFSIVYFIFMKLFRESHTLKETMNRFAWTIYPYSWLFFCFAMICLILQFIIPFYYHLIFFITIGVFFIIFFPITLQRFYDKNFGEIKSDDLRTYKMFLAYYLTLSVILILWSINHYSIILLGFF
ncbi:MAG: hypothetical protein ACTSQJ_06805 [Promethearchaeota archaeon]